MYLKVAVPVNLHQTFTYESQERVPDGCRVSVPFGPRSLIGVVVGEEPVLTDTNLKIRKIKAQLDPEPIYSKAMLELGIWMSSYYIHPIGETLKAMLPASQVSKKQTRYRQNARKKPIVGSKIGRILGRLFAQKETLDSAYIKTRLKKLSAEDISCDQQLTFEDIRPYLAIATTTSGSNLRKTDSKPETPTISQMSWPSPPYPLTALQQEKLSIIETHTRETHLKPVLLHGITGAGKTEIYMRLIQRILEGDPTSQSLILVPEIALTPQMTNNFAERFPNAVSVVHSAMSDKERWKSLESVRRGETRILIGPRSAIFAPFDNLKLVIIDEEHDSSYKQSTGLRYNGRDVGVMRCRFEGIPIILGSATPSLESHLNAQQGKYELVTLMERASGRPLPKITIVDGTAATKPKSFVSASRLEVDDQIPIHEDILAAIENEAQKKQQSMLLVNRRGFAYYLFHLETREPIQCKRCSISMTLHSRSRILKCHYCDNTLSITDIAEEYPEDEFLIVGYGSEKAEAFIRNRFPNLNIARLDADTTRMRENLPKIIEAFRQRETDVLVGTQMLAKGHDFPGVSLIAILEADQMLALPDFRAGERTFQLIVQAAGRAGRTETSGHVFVQSLQPHHSIVQAAATHSYESFVAHELPFREANDYPPFSRMTVIECQSDDIRRIEEFEMITRRWFEAREESWRSHLAALRILGPASPPIEMVRGFHRRTLMLSSQNVTKLNTVAEKLYLDLLKSCPKCRISIDVDPYNLL